MTGKRDPVVALAAALAAIVVTTLLSRWQALTLILFAAGAVGAFAGVPARRAALGMAPFLFFAATSAWLYLAVPADAPVGGRTAITVFLRILATGLISVVYAATADLAGLARALTRRFGLSRRFALGALAAIQFMPQLRRDLAEAVLTARAATPASAGRWRGFFAPFRPGLALALFVLAIRRAETLALAMEARGLSRSAPAGDWRAVAVGWVDHAFLGAVALSLVAAVFVEIAVA